MAGETRFDDERRTDDNDDRRGRAPQGARRLTAFLPNGRMLWLRVDVPLAPAASVTHLAQVAENGVERRASSAIAQRDAIDRLAQTVQDDVERLERERAARAAVLRRKLVAADVRLDERLTKARDQLRARVDKQLKIDRESVQRLRRRDLWDQILVATALPLFAAYGQRTSPFASHNLTLVVSLLISLAGDLVIEKIFGTERASPYAVRDADIWSYLAPLTYAVSGWWLLSDRQHSRFITGVTPVTLKRMRPVGRGVRAPYRYGGTVDVDLKQLVAPDHLADFKTFTKIPALATVRGALRWQPKTTRLAARVTRVAANVKEAKLKLSLKAIAQRSLRSRQAYPPELTVDIAWMVDTDKPTTLASGK